MSLATSHIPLYIFFFFNDTATTEIYTLSLHDALPISTRSARSASTSTILPLPSSPHWAPTTTTQWVFGPNMTPPPQQKRSEEHTSELQSPCNLVCRLLLEKKKKTQQTQNHKP